MDLHVYHTAHDAQSFIILQKIQESWYEKLHEWDRALEAYNQKLEANPDDINLTLGRMRCLEAMGEW